MASRGAERIRLSQHESFLRHRGFFWLRVAVLLSAAAAAAYLMADDSARNGGSWLGYILGSAGALLILWLTLLGLRKRVITPGGWSLKAWTSAHVYLGLSLIVIATLHTGFQFGINLHTLAYLLMMLVILSGACGMWFYATLPDDLSTIRAQKTRPEMIDELQKLNRQLETAAQPLGVEDVELVQLSISEDPFARGLVRRLLGSDRSGRGMRALARLKARHPEVTGSGTTPLDAVVELMERQGPMLMRIRRYLTIRARLEAWLFVHIPLTFALIAALAAHIVSVFFYW